MHGSAPTDGFTPPAGGMVGIPDVIPIFPLPGVVLLPGEVLPLHIFEPRYRAMVKDALDGHRVIGMVELEGSDDGQDVAPSPVREVGCVGLIAEHRELPDGRYLIWLLGLERFRIDEELASDTLYRQVRVSYTPIHESATALAGLFPVRNELLQALPRLIDTDERSRQELQRQMQEVSNSQLIALASQILELPSLRKRQLLEADTQVDRFMLVCEDLYRHLDGTTGQEAEPSETLN